MDCMALSEIMTCPSLSDKPEMKQEMEPNVFIPILWCFVILSVLLNIRD